jgi:hypothetical protein
MIRVKRLTAMIYNRSWQHHSSLAMPSTLSITLTSK